MKNNFRWYKTEWHQKAVKALQLAGKGKSTQDAYVRAMRKLAEFYDKTPDKITEEELVDYFVHRQEVTEWSPATMRICHAGIRFFFTNVLKREWHTLKLAKAKREKRLPAVLSRGEVKKFFSHVTTFHNYAYLKTVYTCGLRLKEGLGLQVSDIDGARNLIHVHGGKGARDRYVPLPKATYRLLKRYWLTHKNEKLIFPAVGRGQNRGSVSKKPMSIGGVQGAFRRAKMDAGIRKRASIHTLRHSYATHLLEAGVNLKVIQKHLGHSNIETTMVYLHLTNVGMEDAYRTIDSLMTED